MLTEVKEIKEDVIKKILEKVGFTFNPANVREFIEDRKKILSHLNFLLFLESKEFPEVIINPYSEESFYNPERNYINVGIPLCFSKESVLPPFGFVKSLFLHELSHEVHTEIDAKKLPYPFILLNILEDERIERLAEKKWMKTGETFAHLHYISFNAYYKDKDEAEFCRRVFSPYNYIIVSRWSRWSSYIFDKREELKKVDSWSEIHEKLGEKKNEYFEDVEKVLDDATASRTTEELVENTVWFYNKWKELLEGTDMKQILAGIGHTKPDIAEEDRDPEEELSEEAREWIEAELSERLSFDPEFEADREWSIYDEPEVRGAESEFSEEELWKLDRTIVERLKKEIKKIQWKSRKTEMQRSMLGRRPDARRVENLLPNPMRRKKETEKTNIPKVLFVIDGSGSMHGFPYWNSVHLAYAFKEVLEENVDIIVTTPSKAVKIENLKALLYFECDGGTENLKSVEQYLKDYELVIFFTDACVRVDDEDFLKRIRSEKVIGILTTMDREEAEGWLPEFFKKVVVSESVERLVKELAFLLRRR